MGRRARFFLSRVHKAGALADADVVEACRKPRPVEAYRYQWAITNFAEVLSPTLGYYGHLVKLQPSAEVPVVDRLSWQEAVRSQSDMIMAASPFVFIPQYAVVAHMRVWNHISENGFRKRFSDIVLNTQGRFLSDFTLTPVNDPQRFYTKLMRFERITQISASVCPPNPLYGPVWKPVKDFLSRRCAQKLEVKEKAGDGVGIKSRIKEVLAGFLQGAGRPSPAISDDLDSVDHIEMPPGADAVGPMEDSNVSELDITDASVFMALDGYGHGAVTGTAGGDEVTVKTGEASMSFVMDTESSPEDLCEEVCEIMDRFNDERGMRH